MDCGKIVVGQHHIRRGFGHVCAGNAHGHANVRRLEGRSVVDAVAGHGNDMPFGPQSFDHSHLVLGRNPSEHPQALNRFRQLLFCHLVQLLAGKALALVLGNTQLLGDGQSGVPMVAGDHHCAHRSVLKGSNGLTGLLPGRVDHADQTDERQLLLPRRRVPLTASQGQRPQRLARHLAHGA